MMIFAQRVKRSFSFRFNARMTPIRANIDGPSCSTTSNSASIAARHSGVSFCLWKLGDVKRVAQRYQLAPARQDDRVEKFLVPTHDTSSALTR
jgi:hypothetical protein